MGAASTVKPLYPRRVAVRQNSEKVNLCCPVLAETVPDAGNPSSRVSGTLWRWPFSRKRAAAQGRSLCHGIRGDAASGPRTQAAAEQAKLAPNGPSHAAVGLGTWAKISFTGANKR